jgi:hypothetical protein
VLVNVIDNAQWEAALHGLPTPWPCPDKGSEESFMKRHASPMLPTHLIPVMITYPANDVSIPFFQFF